MDPFTLLRKSEQSASYIDRQTWKTRTTLNYTTNTMTALFKLSTFHLSVSIFFQYLRMEFSSQHIHYIRACRTYYTDFLLTFETRIFLHKYKAKQKWSRISLETFIHAAFYSWMILGDTRHTGLRLKVTYGLLVSSSNEQHQPIRTNQPFTLTKEIYV